MLKFKKENQNLQRQKSETAKTKMIKNCGNTPISRSQLFQKVFQQISRSIRHRHRRLCLFRDPDFRDPVSFAQSPSSPGKIRSNSSTHFIEKLFSYLSLLNAAECDRIRRQFKANADDDDQRKSTSETEDYILVNELLCALLFEIEKLCDKITQLIEITIQSFGSNSRTLSSTMTPDYQQQQQASHFASITCTSISYRVELLQQALQAALAILDVARLALIDIGENSYFRSLPPLYATICGDNNNRITGNVATQSTTLIPIHVHVTATAANACTVSRDARIMIAALIWYANLCDFTQFINANQ